MTGGAKKKRCHSEPMHDSSVIATIEQRMKDCTRRLHALAPMVGSAKQVREWSADMRKMALSIEMAKHLKSGESAAAAECLARASDAYAGQMATLATQYAEAEKTLAQWTAEQASFDACRSLLSMQKETMRQLEG